MAFFDDNNMSPETIKPDHKLHGVRFGEHDHLMRNTIYNFGDPSGEPEEYLIVTRRSDKKVSVARVSTVASTTDGAESLKVVHAALPYGQRLSADSTLLYTKKVKMPDGAILERIIGLPKRRDYAHIRRRMPMRG